MFSYGEGLFRHGENSTMASKEFQASLHNPYPPLTNISNFQCSNHYSTKTFQPSSNSDKGFYSSNSSKPNTVVNTQFSQEIKRDLTTPSHPSGVYQSPSSQTATQTTALQATTNPSILQSTCLSSLPLSFHSHRTTTSTKSRRPKQSVPEAEKNAEYKRRRMKNNDAARRSRELRKKKEDANETTLLQLNQELEVLKVQIAQVESRVGVLKGFSRSEQAVHDQRLYNHPHLSSYENIYPF